MEGYVYLTLTGTILADTADVRATVEAEWKRMFGQDLIVSSDTPQGTLINAETAARVDVMRNNAQLANQINPKLAGGQFLDSICSFLGLERRQATYSVVNGVLLTGIPGTPIPRGARARSRSGHLWVLITGVTLGPGGGATGAFRCVEAGPVQCAAGTLDSVAEMILGWETVTNPTAAELGENEQSDASLRMLRNNTLGRQGISVSEAVVSGLYDQPVNARSVAYRENVTNVPLTVDGVTLVPNSIWACVDGGTDADIFQSLLRDKTVGANWNGAVTGNVIDPTSGQTYIVKFDRPIKAPIEAQFTVRKGLYTGDPVLDVPIAVVNYAAGNVEAMPGFVVGAMSVSPDQIAAGVAAQLVGLFIVDAKVRKVGTTTWSPSSIPLIIREIATIAVGHVSVVVQP